MKLFSFFAATAYLATLAFAQKVDIAAPPTGSSVALGAHVVVQLERPLFDGTVQEGKVTLTIFPEGDPIGTVLYDGSFEPQEQPDNKPPKQNFTIKIPPGAKPGPAMLKLKHSSVVGQQNQPFSETKDIKLEITKAQQ